MYGLFDTTTSRTSRLSAAHANGQFAWAAWANLSVNKSRCLLQREIVDVDIALRVPAVDVDRDAGLRGTGGKRHAQLRIAATARPIGCASLYAEVGIRPVYVSGERISVVGLDRDRLVTLTRGGTGRSDLERMGTAVNR